MSVDSVVRVAEYLSPFVTRFGKVDIPNEYRQEFFKVLGESHDFLDPEDANIVQVDSVNRAVSMLMQLKMVEYTELNAQDTIWGDIANTALTTFGKEQKEKIQGSKEHDAVLDEIIELELKYLFS